MRIINLLDDSEDIEPPLREIAASTDRLQARAGQMLLELVRYLQAQGVTPEVHGMVSTNELWLNSPNPLRKGSLKIWPDCKDYAPLINGIPEMHYRIEIHRAETKLSSDARTSSLTEVARIIDEAFGWNT